MLRAAVPTTEKLFDANMVKEMISIVLDNAFVTHKGSVFRQAKGMPMGINCAPQLANLYCGHYELSYMVRATAQYLSSTPRLRVEKAYLNAMFNGSRFIDDIGLAGIPCVLYHGRSAPGPTQYWRK